MTFRFLVQLRRVNQHEYGFNLYPFQRHSESRPDRPACSRCINELPLQFPCGCGRSLSERVLLYLEIPQHVPVAHTRTSSGDFPAARSARTELQAAQRDRISCLGNRSAVNTTRAPVIECESTVVPRSVSYRQLPEHMRRAHSRWGPDTAESAPRGAFIIATKRCQAG